MALAPEVARGQPPQLGVDLRQEPVEGFLAAVAPLLQQLGDLCA